MANQRIRPPMVFPYLAGCNRVDTRVNPNTDKKGKNYSEIFRAIKKLGNRESNPDFVVQSHAPYRWTIPQ